MRYFHIWSVADNSSEPNDGCRTYLSSDKLKFVLNQPAEVLPHLYTRHRFPHSSYLDFHCVMFIPSKSLRVVFHAWFCYQLPAAATGSDLCMTSSVTMTTSIQKFYRYHSWILIHTVDGKRSKHSVHGVLQRIVITVGSWLYLHIFHRSSRWRSFSLSIGWRSIYVIWWSVSSLLPRFPVFHIFKVSSAIVYFQVRFQALMSCSNYFSGLIQRIISNSMLFRILIIYIFHVRFQVMTSRSKVYPGGVLSAYGANVLPGTCTAAFRTCCLPGASSRR